MTTRHRARLRALLAPAAALAGVALVLGAAPAAAHNTLSGSTPADDSTVTDPVTEVVLEFDQAVQSDFAQVAVLGADRTPYGSGAPVVVGRTVTQAVESLPDGRYDVSYRAVSADGHPVSGTISFTASGQAAPRPVATPTAEPTTPAVAEPTPADADPAPVTSEADPTGGAVAVSGDTGLPTAALVGGALAAAAGVATVALLVVRQRPGGDAGAGPADTGS
jgi:methionine-rich copper-binding protein CopC